MKQRMKKTGRMDPGEMEDMEGGERVTHEWMEPEYQSKERIKAFDREWMEMDVDRYFASKIVYIIMNIMGCFMMFFPVGFDINAGVICVITWMLLGIAVISRIQPYVYGMGRGEDVISVLAYVPIDRKLMCRIRREYLRSYLYKVGLVCLAVQQVGALLNDSWSVLNLLYPVLMVLSLYLVGVLYIGW